MEYKSTFVLFTVMSIALLAATIVVSYGSQQVQAAKPAWCYNNSVAGLLCFSGGDGREQCQDNQSHSPYATSKCKPSGAFNGDER